MYLFTDDARSMRNRSRSSSAAITWAAIVLPVPGGPVISATRPRAAREQAPGAGSLPEPARALAPRTGSSSSSRSSFGGSIRSSRLNGQSTSAPEIAEPVAGQACGTRPRASRRRSTPRSRDRGDVADLHAVALDDLGQGRRRGQARDTGSSRCRAARRSSSDRRGHLDAMSTTPGNGRRRNRPSPMTNCRRAEPGADGKRRSRTAPETRSRLRPSAAPGVARAGGAAASRRRPAPLVSTRQRARAERRGDAGGERAAAAALRADDGDAHAAPLAQRAAGSAPAASRPASSAAASCGGTTAARP